LADERDCLELAAAIGESVESYDSDYLLEVIIPHLQPVIGEIDALRAERDALKDEVQRLQDELTGTNEGVNDLANLRNSAEEALNDIAHFCGEGHVEHGEWDFKKSAAEIMEEWKKDRAERDALKDEVQRLREAGEAAKEAIQKLTSIALFTNSFKASSDIRVIAESALHKLTAPLRVP